MRLLYVCSDFGIRPNGTKGASIHLRAITRALTEAGHALHLLSPHGGAGKDPPATPLATTVPAFVRQVRKLLKGWLVAHGYDEGASGELRSLLYNASLGDHVLDAAREIRPHAIIERLSLFGHGGLDLAGALDVPLVVEVNAILTEEARRFRSLELQSLAAKMERRVLSAADAVIAVSAPLADRLVELGVDRNRIHVIPNGVDIAAFERAPSREACRDTLGLNGAFLVGFAGSLKVWHGVDILLRAFERLHGEDRQTRLMIIGTGPMETELRRTAEEMGLAEAVVFTGAVPHERVPIMLRALDVAVAPFKPVDGFYFSPIKLFEYMASGACAIASRLGQIEDVIEDGVNGLLVNPDDSCDLYVKLRKLRQSGYLRERLAAQAARTVSERYTWARAAEQTLTAVCEAVMRTGHSRHAAHDPAGVTS